MPVGQGEQTVRFLKGGVSLRCDRALLIGQMLLGVGALIYAVWGMDWASLLKAMGKLNVVPMSIVLFCLFLDVIFMGGRLYFILERHFSPYSTLKATILCSGYNNLLPAKAGDLVKFFYLQKKNILSIPELASLIIWERVMDVFMIFLLWLFFIVYYMKSSILLPCIALVIGVVGFWGMRQFSNFFYRLYARFPWAKLGELLYGIHRRGIMEIRPVWFVTNIFFSLLAWGAYYASFYVAINIVGQGNMNWAHILVVFAVTCTGMAIPSSPGGIGVFEAGMVLAMSWYGFTREEALPLALFLHVVYFLPTSVTALILAARLPRRNVWKSGRHSNGEGPMS